VGVELADDGLDDGGAGGHMPPTDRHGGALRAQLHSLSADYRQLNIARRWRACALATPSTARAVHNTQQSRGNFAFNKKVQKKYKKIA
jgi:hypothetical protein